MRISLSWAITLDKSAHERTDVVNKLILEKVHSTTLIYWNNLSFNPQPQNQIFSTHKLSKPSNLHPSAVF
jgi:hypothetical protein